MYTTLLQGQFRALSVSSSDPITLSLTTLSLDKAPKYAALSYTWGRAPYRKGRSFDATYHIIVDGIQISVQENLHDALEHLIPQLQRRSFPMFVDAVCINQSDLKEKAEQVQQMRSIYEGAEIVFAWLGVPYDDAETQLAVKQMRRFRELLVDARTGEGDNIHSFPLSVSAEGGELFPTDPNSVTHIAWMGIQEMFNQAYWQRTWILQEATGPAETRYYCGKHSFGKTQLAATVYFGYLYSQHKGANTDFVRNIGVWGSAPRVSEFRGLDGSFPQQGSASYGGTRLIDLCQTFRNSRCADARDKVFAPRYLAMDLKSDELKADYTRAPEYVYVDVAELYLRKDANLDFLGFVVHPVPDSLHMKGEALDVENSIPSWVPDWRQRITINPLQKALGGIIVATAYSACKGFRGIPPEIVGRNLHVHSHRFDVVSRVSSICDVSFSEPTGVESLDHWMVEVELPRGTYPRSSLTYEEAFLVTLVGDLCYDSIDKVYKRGGKMFWLSETPVSREHLLMRESSAAPHSSTCVGRRLARTEQGFIGIVPAAAQVGDCIAVVSHASVPLILRHGARDRYKFVGECYIHGIMDGEAVHPDMIWERLVLE